MPFSREPARLYSVVRSRQNSMLSWLNVYMCTMSQPARRQKLQNSFVLCEPLPHTDIDLIEDLFMIKSSKSAHGNSKSPVWHYFGELRAKVTVETTTHQDRDMSTTNSKLIDDEFYYCRVCLEQEQRNIGSPFRSRISSVEKHSKRALTTSMRDHMKHDSNVVLSMQSSQSQQTMMKFTSRSDQNSCRTEYSKGQG